MRMLMIILLFTSICFLAVAKARAQDAGAADLFCQILRQDRDLTHTCDLNLDAKSVEWRVMLLPHKLMHACYYIQSSIPKGSAFEVYMGGWKINIYTMFTNTPVQSCKLKGI